MDVMLMLNIFVVKINRDLSQNEFHQLIKNGEIIGHVCFEKAEYIVCNAVDISELLEWCQVQMLGTHYYHNS